MCLFGVFIGPCTLKEQQKLDCCKSGDKSMKQPNKKVNTETKVCGRTVRITDSLSAAARW